MKQTKLKTLSQKIDFGVKKGVALALAEHKKMGKSIAVWRNGKVVNIPPEKIKIQKEFQENTE
ncbi:MAG: hypothetical protein WCW01_02970 [Gammaproteobacteria bacterium]